MRMKGEDLDTVQVYVPELGCTIKEELKEELQREIDSKISVVMGDFNAHVNSG